MIHSIFEAFADKGGIPMTGKNPGVVWCLVFPAVLFALAACGGPKVVYTAKVGAVSYAPVEASAVSVFESTPQKGSYIELGEVAIEDELKCDMGKAYEEERALGILERLRKENPDMADVSDTTMLELLAERGSIERDDICTLVLRFSRKEEKSSFIVMALKGSNLKFIASKVGEMGANAVMKIKHHDWQMRQNPSSFGADATQVPGLKVGVKTTGIAIHYEGPEGETGPAETEDKVLVVVKGKTETGTEEGEEKPEKEEKKPVKAAPSKAAETKAEKGKPAAPAEKKEDKKPVSAEAAALLDEAKKKAEEIAAAEKAIEDKQKEQKELRTGITADKEKIKELKKEMTKLKMKAAKAKAEEEKLKAEEDKKAKALAKKMKEQKLEEEKKALAETKAKEAEKAEKKEEKAAAKEVKKDEKASEKETKKEVKVAAKDVKKAGKDEEEEADVSESVTEAKEKVKVHKSKIFDCLHDGKMEGAVKVTFLFKPSGEIDALGFSPDAPEKVHKCIMQLMAKEKFPSAARYYKAIFKYTVK
jgi:hypothetical protein